MTSPCATFSAAQADDLYEMITERAGCSLDRLVNGAHHLAMQGRSYRPNKRPGRPVGETEPPPVWLSLLI